MLWIPLRLSPKRYLEAEASKRFSYCSLRSRFVWIGSGSAGYLVKAFTAEVDSARLAK
jgi:hypothetical protein